MTGYTELKPLLEACRAENCDGPREFRKAVEALFDVCTVETISALITENERLNAECKQLILLECHGGTAEAAINLLAERDQLKAENEALRQVMSAVVAEIPGAHISRSGNAHGHCHSIPGVWDRGNGAKAGKECAWCKVWNYAAAMGKGEQS